MMVATSLTTKTPIQLFLERSFYPKETAKKLLQIITMKAREEILKMHPLYFADREEVELLYLDKDLLTVPLCTKRSLIPIYKRFFTLDDEWFLKKCKKELVENKDLSLQKKDFSLANLKRFVNEYLSAIEQFSDDKSYYAIKNLARKTKVDKKGYAVSEISSTFEVEKPINITFYSFDLRKNTKIKVSPEKLKVRILNINPKNILL